MKFKNRIIAAITISSVSFNLIFGFFAIRKEMNIERERLNNKITHYDTLLEKINTGSLWDFDSEKIKSNLNIVFADPEVDKISLRDVTGTIDISMSKDGVNTADPFVTRDIKIQRNGYTLADVRIVYSMALYNSKLYSLITEKLLLTLGLILINILAVYFISGYLLKPIDSVVEALKEIDSGNRGARLRINSGDEFDQIVTYFNKMAGTIQSEIEVRIERERQLRDMHDYLSNLFNSIPSVLLSLDRTGLISKLNQAAERFTGRTAGDITGKPVWEIFPLLNEFRDDIDSVLMSGSSMNIKRSYTSPDSELYMDISIASLYHGGITGAVVRIDDVTLMKKKDEKLIQAQMMDSIGNMAGGIAHDFNNVLSGITGTVSLLKYKLVRTELTESELEKFLNIIDDSGKRAVDLTKQIVSLSRKSEINLEGIDLNDVIMHVYNFCMHSFDKSINILPLYYPEPAMAKADATRIQQVVLNLCINANHAMTVMRPVQERAGGILKIGLSRTSSGVSAVADITGARPGTDFWVITVEDNGIGMDKKTIEKIFEPFFTTKEKGRGTGLGLSMAYNIVRMHNGFLDVISEPGMGSTFSVYIPVAENMAAAEKKPAEVIPYGKGTVLVIDDEESICKTSKEMLEYCGYDVIFECSPENAVKSFMDRAEKIDCVILDLNMPKRSGLEVLKDLKAVAPAVKVLISSGSVSEEKMISLSEAGAMAFITKPYTLETLANAVHALLF